MIITYRGRVRNGLIVLNEPGQLPEGVEVEVRALSEETTTTTLYERLKNVIGIAEGLPSDMARNHDHYIHGASKR
ncbi:MAG: hypothetical protein HOP29_05690 [Phycisphaerales bacterium]|nr:hypothetical protein [Phycisphaerales bacterium]